MYGLYRFCTGGGNVVWSDSHQRAVLLVQFGVHKRHLFSTNHVPFPKAGEAGQKWTRDLIKPMAVACPHQIHDDEGQDRDKIVYNRVPLKERKRLMN
jgi:hypothetical protein